MLEHRLAAIVSVVALILGLGPAPREVGIPELIASVAAHVGVDVGRPSGDSRSSVRLGRVQGSQPWATILCKYADVEAVPHEVDWYVRLMGSEYPGMDHYWRELSYGQMDLSGSGVFGWYRLPKSLSAYLEGGRPRLDDLVQDCVGASEDDVDLGDFVGVNLMFNAVQDVGCYGGRRRIGSQSIRVTWLFAGYCQDHQVLVAHEMSHTYGLDHVVGPNLFNYDSVGGYGGCLGHEDPSFGCVGAHANAYHKTVLGWIPSERIAHVGLGTTARLSLLPLSDRPADGQPGFLVAEVPISGAETYFTVEARRRHGYDGLIPMEGVLIHFVDPSLPDLRSTVMVGTDADPFDAATWQPGESFVDEATGISVDVTADSAAGGFDVTIVNPCSLMGSDDDEQLVGTPGDDVICGGGGNDVIVGGDGDDVLVGGDGNDRLDGGPGVDSVDYAAAPGAVDVDLESGVATGWGIDSLDGIEGVIGSGYDDRIAGDGSTNVLVGGPGQDVVDYSISSSRVAVDLRRDRSTGWGADTLIAIEGVIGSGFNDVLRGSSIANRLLGGRGNDRVYGLGGDDFLDGGPKGFDVLDGGVGVDRCVRGEELDACEG